MLNARGEGRRGFQIQVCRLFFILTRVRVHAHDCVHLRAWSVRLRGRHGAALSLLPLSISLSLSSFLSPLPLSLSLSLNLSDSLSFAVSLARLPHFHHFRYLSCAAQ